jgi:hypothetical protein
MVGVWAAAASGQGDSGYAHLGPAYFAGAATVSYSYLLPKGGRYAVHVGCGGTASRWASTDLSPLLSHSPVHLNCAAEAGSRPGEAATAVPCPVGRCAVVTITGHVRS